MRRAFEEESERLSCEIARHTAHIGEWEEQMTHKIMDDATLSDEQKMRKMQEEVYGKLDEMYRQAEGSKEYRKAIAEHQKFMRENELVRDSTLYNLKRTSPEAQFPQGVKLNFNRNCTFKREKRANYRKR